MTARDTEASSLDERAWRASWWLSTVWLVFAVLPLLPLWLLSDLSTLRRVVATLLTVVFAAVYAVGFRETTRREAGHSVRHGAGRFSMGILAALILLNAVAVAAGGWAMLGLVPFIPAFAMLNVSWRLALGVAAGSLVATVGAPLVGGVFADLWSIALATTIASAATGLGRLAEERSRERTEWRTELMLSDDRNRVARDVHDVLGHSLTAVVIKAELTSRLLAKLDPADDADREIVDRCRSELDELQSLSRGALAEIRSTVGGLRRPNLADEIAAARTVLADAGATYTSAGDVSSVPLEARGPLAWVVRESITN
ncbi:MAG: sensor histidine kinase, partial [Acidimicrobiales bacterium]